jgi:serine/threonine protein kinase
MLSTKKPDLEPLPGYRLLEPLGKGGFGEVWKCVAPGGLHKAMKFVHGNGSSLLEGSCPSSDELRAIQRIKDIRHPFLLSMERVERCGDELVIVMELADRSLDDLLREHPGGLPREEVLGYLREAAEVLDLMNFEYGLQHLDIKPRNLFLVRGHVKVADFGLVQDLGDTATRLDGLKSEALHLSVVTPLYAAPELFQNKLSRRCDQYSLAIVYQELLTGIRPVEGKNVRQLMMQHTVGQPNLEPLPEHDRPVIARALAKDPAERHYSCLELVNALSQAIVNSRLGATNGRGGRNRAASTMRPQAGRDTRSTAMGATQILGPAEGRALPDIEFVGCLSRDPRGETWEAKSAEGQPKIVHLLYGIGGAGGKHDPEVVMHLQNLRHPAILPMRLVPSGPGCLLLVTDRVEPSLRQRYQECQTRGETGVPRGELLDRLEQTADTLDQLYQQQGLHHLELSPSRILISGERVALDQIGIAQLLWVPSGVPCGEAQLRYTAPERAQGLITRSCDQYSLAVIYQELLTGRHPFRGASQNRVLGARDRTKPIRTLDLQPLLSVERPVVARALDPDPERRYGSCMDFIRALRAAGASAAARSESPANNDPERAARQEQIARMIEEAKQWLRMQQGESDNEPEPEDGLEVLRRRFVAVVPPGAGRRKFDGFCQQWDAKVVEEGETFAVFQVTEKSRSWLPWRGKPAALRVEVRWTKPGAVAHKMPEVVVRVVPVTVSCKASAALLPQLGPQLLESLQTSLLGSPERRNGERVLWPHPVEVSCLAPGRPRGQWLACQGKDVSLTGMGCYINTALPSSQVQLRLTTPGTGETLVLPGSIVRIQRWDEQLFEVGVIFE